MLSTDLQNRFASNCIDAMQGYMAASNAASAAMMGQMLDGWANAVRTMSGLAVTDTRQLDLPIARMGAGLPMPGPQQFMDMWLSMTPFGRSPVVLQMAYAMMAFGVPRSVAMPTAEANAAVMNAAEVAAEPLKEAFASYRTDGGHASAQVIMLSRMMSLAMAAPFGAMAAQPWMVGTRAVGF
jgi:hypothetical protein